MSRSFQARIGSGKYSFDNSEISKIENEDRFYDIIMDDEERNQFVLELFHNMKNLENYPVGWSFNTIRIIMSKDLFAFIKNDNKRVMEYNLQNKVVSVLQEMFPNKEFKIGELRPHLEFKERNPIDWRHPYIIGAASGGIIAGIFYLIATLIEKIGK